MKSQAEKIKHYLMKHIAKHPKDIVLIAMEEFNVTRTTIHRHLEGLLKQKKIVKTGKTRQTSYFLNTEKNRVLTFTVTAELSEADIWEQHMYALFKELPDNIRGILQYGFTEIFNNAIDHAEARKIRVLTAWFDDKLRLTISDDGIGVFERIGKTFHYTDSKECLLHLTKGKLTTDPMRHSGEGLFFTSRIFDAFYLTANGISFQKDNRIKDWTVEKAGGHGTTVMMEIDFNNPCRLIDFFNQYTDLEDFSFCKTEVLVDLSQLKDENLISRSQAKRILENLDPFKSVTLDFAKVTSVGQGFVDEIFRVYKLKNPQAIIHYINANEEVEFMIKRSVK